MATKRGSSSVLQRYYDEEKSMTQGLTLQEWCARGCPRILDVASDSDLAIINAERERHGLPAVTS